MIGKVRPEVVAQEVEPLLRQVTDVSLGFVDPS
jgi:hypothetical protein